MNNFEKARDAQTLWKPGPLLNVSWQLVKVGLEQLNCGFDYFGPDDLPDAFHADGQGLTGSAVHLLRSINIIRDYIGDHADQGIFHGRRRSKRKAANGRKVCLYQLCSRGVAEAFLKRHATLALNSQMDLMQRQLFPFPARAS